MTLEERVTALEDVVRKLATLVEADIEGLRETDDEVARQGRSAARAAGWPNRSPANSETQPADRW